VDEIVSRIRTTGARTIGISGIDCAGKSSLALALADELGDALVVHGDEFTRPVAERSDYLASFDYGFVYDVLLPAVRDGVTGRLMVHVTDWENDGWRDETFVLGPESFVIVEGCFLFTGRERAFDLTVWIECAFDVALSRALLRTRDLERMGGEAGVRARYAERYFPAQALHLERDDPVGRADIVL
jgi:uridine kinase